MSEPLARKAQPPANDVAPIDPALRPFIEAMAALLLEDLKRRPLRAA